MNEERRRNRRPELRPLPGMLMGQLGGGGPELQEPGLMLGLQRWNLEEEERGE